MSHHKPIKLGIIGFGRIVELVHLPLLKKLPELTVSGVYDITPQRLDLAARRGFQVFAELHDLLKSSVDAVLVATPPSTHFELAAKALQYGKHVVLEKPVTVTAEEAIRLRMLANERGKLVTVFHNRRYDSDFIAVKNVISEDVLGPLLFVERRHHMFGSGASFGVKSFYPDWRNESCYGGGALLDWGVHLIDQLLELRLGSIHEVDAQLRGMRWQQGSVDDFVRADFRMDNGILASLEVNFGSNANVPMWVVGGEAGTLQVNNPKEAVLYRKGKPAESVSLDSALSSGPEHIYAALAASVLGSGELAVSLDQAVETMRIIDAIRHSAEMKKGEANGNFILRAANRV